MADSVSMSGQTFTGKVQGVCACNITKAGGGGPICMVHVVL